METNPDIEATEAQELEKTHFLFTAKEFAELHEVLGSKPKTN